MKQFLFIVLVLAGLASCSYKSKYETKPAQYHGIDIEAGVVDGRIVEVLNPNQRITLPLVAFQDNSVNTFNLTGSFLIGCGDINSDITNLLKYRLIIEFPDKTMKMYEVPANSFMEYVSDSIQPTITITLKDLLSDSQYKWEKERRPDLFFDPETIVIRIPRGSIRYSNEFDGK